MNEIDTGINHVKAQIVTHLCRLINDRTLTQTEAGELLGLASEEVSGLFSGGCQEYPLMRLLGFLTAFGQDVEITVRPHAQPGERGQITFTPATV